MASSRPARPAGVPRNHKGFRDGIANPDVAATPRWPGGCCGWARAAAAGRGRRAGTYHVIRVIRMFTETWDELPVAAQERIVGRRRDGRRWTGWWDRVAGQSGAVGSDRRSPRPPAPVHRNPPCTV